MAGPQNSAFYVSGKDDFLIRTDLPLPQPAQDEVLVKVIYSGLNPADIKHSQMLGMTDTVIGYDFCGEVLDPGSSEYSKGDIVAGMTPTGIGRPTRYGAHQDYLACPEDMLFSVPTNLPHHHAAALSVVASTAADALFDIFKLPLPDTGTADEHASLLIWGASSAVGISTLQLARAAGVRHIIVTASPARHDLLKSMGATSCWDYAADDVIERIKTATKGQITFALDAVGTPVTATAVEACSSESTILSSTTQTFGRFKMPLATKNRGVKIQLPGMPDSIVLAPDLAASERMRTAVLWVVENYGSRFVLPNVEVVGGTAEELLKVVLEESAGGRFGKIVVKHPFQH